MQWVWGKKWGKKKSLEEFQTASQKSGASLGAGCERGWPPGAGAQPDETAVSWQQSCPAAEVWTESRFLRSQVSTLITGSPCPWQQRRALGGIAAATETPRAIKSSSRKRQSAVNSPGGGSRGRGKSNPRAAQRLPSIRLISLGLADKAFAILAVFLAILFQSLASTSCSDQRTFTGDIYGVPPPSVVVIRRGVCLPARQETSTGSAGALRQPPVPAPPPLPYPSRASLFLRSGFTSLSPS